MGHSHVLISPQELSSEFINSPFVYLTLWIINCIQAWSIMIPPEEVCLEMSTIHVLALDYLVALYLLILKSSIVEAFASFILLSFDKLLSISFDLLVPTRLYNIHGEQVNKMNLFYDATVEVISSNNLIFAVIAIVVLVVFILFPLLLLLLYPLRCFHKCLDYSGIRYYALMVFTDAFQGAYKNGTNSTRDHRWFAIVYSSAHILCYIIYAITLSTFDYALTTFVLIGIVVLITVVQPCITTSHNIIDTLIMLTSSLMTASLTTKISTI